MKKQIMMITVAFAAAIPIMADTEAVDGIEWTYLAEYNNAEKQIGVAITGAKSLDAESVIDNDAPEMISGAVTIPTKLGGWPVTSVGVPLNVRSLHRDIQRIYLGADPYRWFDDVTSISIPSNVLYFSINGINSLLKLDSFIVAEDNPSYRSVDGVLFTKNGKVPLAVPRAMSNALADEIAEMWKKSQIVNGAAFSDGRAVGIVRVKVGKANKRGEVAVSGTITGVDGKKLAAKKGGKVAVNGEAVTATLTVDDGTTATVTIDKDGVSGSWNGAEIKTANVGGKWTRNDAKVYVDATSLPAGTIESLLPAGEPVLAKSGRWTFNNAATVKLLRGETNVTLDTSDGKSNLSAMKLTYTPRTGLFKGSFNVYALKGGRLKKYAVNVSGVVADGVGYGVAKCKKSAIGPWTVTVR